MDMQKGFPTLDQPIECVLETLNCCCLCGTKLIFQHTTNFIDHKVTEKGSCPSCGVKTKENEFVLQ
jgi:hypothetical protein